MATKKYINIGIDARCLEWQIGGVGKYLINFLKNLPNINTKYKFFLYFDSKIPDYDFLFHESFTLRIVKSPSFLKSRSTLKYLFFTANQVRKDDLDLFFCTWFWSPFFMGKIKKIVAAWDISFTSHPSHFSIRTRYISHFLSKKSCQKAEGVITCSEYDAQQISDFYGVSIDKICVVYLAADDCFDIRESKEQLDAIRRKYDLPNKFILSLGAIYTRRNIDKIIHAFHAIKDAYPDFGLVIVGKNHTQPYIDIIKLLNPLVKQKRAVYLGRIDDEELPSLYQAAYTYICTSTVDGETIQLKEAMKSGVPVITSTLLEKTIGGNGFIIADPTSIEETAAVIKHVINHNGNFEELIKNAVVWNNNISWKKISIKTLKFMGKCTEVGSSSPT